MSLDRMRLGGSLAAAVTFSVVLAGCGSAPAPSGAPAAAPAADGAAVRVVASTNVYGSIVSAIGGDRVAVTSIIDSPDADPHEYESTPADAAAVNEAQLVVVNGGGYDGFATKLVDAAAAKPTVIDVVELSGLEPAPAAAPEPAEAGTDEHGHEHGEFNEHVWYSLPTVEKLADRLAADLAATDPAGAATYTGNATSFKGQVDGLIAKLDAIKTAHGGDKVAITEPVPLYTVQDAGLENLTPEEFSEAVEEGNDPPVAVLNETLQLFTAKTVKALLANAQTESPSTTQVEQAATAAGIPVVPVTETLPAGVDDYIAWQTGQIDQLSSALGTPAS
ncbi:metal ABC transporter solute-binding protein, Zn/Mn family [Pseudonocardia charpentierae]|uniref:Zinc ABC transporter substrate-binding protein n=1 Tax=Pseudonocardia charpentierae TaxID=3075545 RepID=A0ABU2NIU8_9PSEU|nr:zinc ABC transporter substrate-binding protein [Pseudonocardia sp. DSM 45834]MDT0353891.1 zinc ABC transporter substrate-binding protein [Pseudonocardia sp. DSM 45834]